MTQSAHRRIAIVLSLAASLTASGCSFCGCADSSRAKAPPGLGASPVDIGDLKARKVGDLAFAGKLEKDAIAAAAAAGYKTVISTLGSGEISWDEKAEVESRGMKFIHIPMGYPLAGISDAMVARFDEAMQDSPRPMLLHCSTGNRVAGLWGVWLAEKKGVKAEEALAAAEQAGMTRVRPLVEKRLGIE